MMHDERELSRSGLPIWTLYRQNSSIVRQIFSTYDFVLGTLAACNKTQSTP
jgi:hypothetical protein